MCGVLSFGCLYNGLSNKTIGIETTMKDRNFRDLHHNLVGEIKIEDYRVKGKLDNNANGELSFIKKINTQADLILSIGYQKCDELKAKMCDLPFNIGLKLKFND